MRSARFRAFGAGDPEPPAATRRNRGGPGRSELIALLAFSMALAALGVDLMLPAFDDIRQSFSLAEGSTAVAGLLTAYFLGVASGQLAYGLLADRFGRKPALYAGYGVYAVGALASALAPSLAVLLVARFVWGLGAAGPRVVTLAVIRDTYEGERMAQAMSFVLAVFILVPVVAPTLGAGVVALVSWRVLVAGCVVAVAGMALWARRLGETLAPDHRLELSLRRVGAATRYVVSNRQTVAYTLAMTALYGVLTSYLGSAELIYDDTFGAGDLFPFLFGGLAAVMGLAMLINARVVERFGTRRLAHGVLLAYVAAAAGMVVLTWLTGGRPPLALFMVAMGLILGGHALLIPNFNTIALMPMASVAGTASSVVGATQLAVGALLGAVLDRTFDGTIGPFSIGVLVYGLLSLGLVLWAEGGRLFQRLPAQPAEDEELAATVPITE